MDEPPSRTDESPECLGLIESEYMKLQEIIERFDDRALTIKAWSVTLCTAGIGAAFFQEQPAVFLVSGFAAMLFRLIEAYWKSNQQAFYDRTWEIENASQAGELMDLRPFSIATAWSRAWDRQHGARQMWREVLWWPHVMLPHVAVAAGGVALFVAYTVFWDL